MKRFTIQSYPVAELAEMYYPDRSPRGALRMFRKELHDTRGLWRALQAEGYKEYTKVFTRTQVRVIVQFLGEP